VFLGLVAVALFAFAGISAGVNGRERSWTRKNGP